MPSEKTDSPPGFSTVSVGDGRRDDVWHKYDATERVLHVTIGGGWEGGNIPRYKRSSVTA